MENAGEGWLPRATRDVFLSFSVALSFLVSLFLPYHLPIHLYTRISLFLSLPASQRELGVTIQSTCFTFKSSCRAAISNRARGMACVHVHHDYSRSTIFHGRAVRCRPVLLRSMNPVSPLLRKEVQNDSEVSDKMSITQPGTFFYLVVNWMSFPAKIWHFTSE